MKKTALVLSGGGSRGAYEIGVWRALGELGEHFDLVTGASVGALNGALVAQGSQELAEKLWKELETTRVFDLPLDESLPPRQKLRAAMLLFGKAAVTQGGADVGALSGLLDTYLDEDAVRASKVDLGLVTVAMGGMKPLYLWKDAIPKGRLADYLLASSSLFPAIRPQVIDGKKYIDGGFWDNLPVQMALDRGARRLIAVHLEAPGVVRKPTLPEGTELVVIDSYWDLGAVLVFDPNSARHNMRLGWLDAMRAFDVFDGRAFAFVKGTLKETIRRSFSDFYEDVGLLGFKSVRRRFLDSVAYAAVKKRVFRRGVGPASAVRGFALTGMECAAELLEMDTGTIYCLDRFHEQLAQKLRQVPLPEALLDKHGGERPEKWLDALSRTLELAQRPARVKFLAYCIRECLARRRALNLLPTAALMADEFCAGLYLALAVPF